MSFQIGDYVKIVNPNHHKFGFEGTIDSVECKIGEYPYYRITRLVGLTAEIVVAQEYEIEETSIIKINTEGWEIGNFKAEKNEFGGLTISPRNVNDDAADSLKGYVDKILSENTKIDKGEFEKMELLKLYEKKMVEKIKEKCDKVCKEIKAQDDFTILRNSYEEDIKDLYEAEFEQKFPYDVEFEMEFQTKETKQKILEAEEEMADELSKLRETVEEIEAHFGMIPVGEYETAMKILRKYGVVNKEGKLNV